MGVETDTERRKSLLERVVENAHLSRLALGLAWQANPRLLVALVCLLAVQAALTPLQLALSRDVVDAAAREVGATHLAGSGPPLVWSILLLATTFAAAALIEPFSRTFQSLVGDRLVGHVTGALVRATNRWPGLARFEDPSTADDLERSSGYAARSGLELVVYGARTLLLGCTAVGLCWALAGLHPLVPVLLVAANLPSLARQFDFQNSTGSRIYVQTSQARTLRYSRNALISPEAAKDVRVFGLGGFFRRRYDDAFESSVGELDRMRWRLTRPMCGSAALAAAGAGAVFVFTAWEVAHGRRGVGDLVLYGGAAAALLSTLSAIGFQVGFLPMVFAFLPSLSRVLAAPPDLPVATNPRPAPRPIRDGIVFENVSFAYPGRDEPVLDRLSLRLRPGESCALVGPNGSGKTTLVKLILRMYDPTGGRILLDGHDLRDYDLDDLRRELGVLFQDFLHYEFSAADNIGFGRVEQSHDRALLLAAAERAGAKDLLDRLPDGLDTQLGARFGGRELSGGEWQKLALARAFARDSQLLVLDEPTAALDPRTEYDIFERFAELTRGRMTVLVSHRFSTVRMADRIVVLRGGRVLEDGRHDELMAAGGEYARLYTTQAAQYLDADPDADPDPDERRESTR